MSRGTSSSSEAMTAIPPGVAAFAADALVDTVRLVLPAPGRRLPVEEAFGIDVEPQGAVV